MFCNICGGFRCSNVPSVATGGTHHGSHESHAHCVALHCLYCTTRLHCVASMCATSVCGRRYSFQVKPGPEGYCEFTHAIRRAFHLPSDAELNIT